MNQFSSTHTIFSCTDQQRASPSFETKCHDFCNLYKKRLDARMQFWLEKQAEHIPSRLGEAMHYAVFNGGKRIRPLLLYASGNLFNSDLTLCDDCACAVEFIHCYSLVHDDLPAMDNDDLRRGQPTCHRAYDEATAILVGDALQALSFGVIAELTSTTGHHLTATKILKVIQYLAQAIGPAGMAGGQMIDIEAVGKATSLTALTKMHQLKTGALIKASILIGALLGDITNNEIPLLESFADPLGLAFQIHDDILDEESSTDILGKTQGTDKANNKPTFVSLMGLATAKEKFHQVCQNAAQQLHKIHSPLRDITELQLMLAYLEKRTC